MENKEYQIIMQHLQAQLERAQEQKKSLDLISVKKKLKDYEQMLQYYTLMRTKNKMKDYKIEFEELWELQRNFYKGVGEEFGSAQS